MRSPTGTPTSPSSATGAAAAAAAAAAASAARRLSVPLATGCATASGVSARESGADCGSGSRGSGDGSRSASAPSVSGGSSCNDRPTSAVVLGLQLHGGSSGDHCEPVISRHHWQQCSARCRFTAAQRHHMSGTRDPLEAYIKCDRAVVLSQLWAAPGRWLLPPRGAAARPRA